MKGMGELNGVVWAYISTGGVSPGVCCVYLRPAARIDSFYQPAAHEACGLVLRLLCIFCVCLYLHVCMCVHTYRVHNNYVMYIVAMRPYFNRLGQFTRLLCVATMSSLAQL